MNKIISAICPKCGETVEKVSFVQRGDMEIDSEKSRHVGQLKRTCPRCGYYWYENSLDDKMDAQKN